MLDHYQDASQTALDHCPAILVVKDQARQLQYALQFVETDLFLVLRFVMLELFQDVSLTV